MKSKYTPRHTDNIFQHLFFLFLFMVLLPGFTSYADAADITNTNSIDQPPTKEKQFQEWAYFPVIASNAQTGLQLGALAIRFIEPEQPGDRTSTIDFIAFGTTKGQYYGKIGPDLYLSNGKYHLNTELSGGFWPLNFYGIGNNTPEENETAYESTEYRIQITLERKILQHTYAGIVGHYENSDVEFESTNRNPAINNDVGAEGRAKSGMGLTFAYDNRDNVNDARTGTFIQLGSLFFEEFLGSDYTFQVYHLDLNHYRSITEATGIAFRGYLQAARGEIPFQDLSSPDGSQLLRGIEDGRYRDRDLVGFQSEFRYKIYQKWGGTFFAETAQVAEEFSDLESSAWKYSVGGGLRYALNPSERFNIRLDLSYVDHGFGLVLNIREAF